MTVKIEGKKHVFRIKGLLPFDPMRKIMSIVVKTVEGQTILFSKGADHAMLARCKMSDERKEKIKNRIDKMASKSYRIMVMAMRELDQELAEKFDQLQIIQKMKNNAKNILLMQQTFEKEFTYLGTTAVEDSLQWKAAETIDRLGKSGLKMWICTGDKLETTLCVA